MSQDQAHSLGHSKLCLCHTSMLPWATCSPSAQHASLRGLCGYTHPVIADKCKELGRDTPIFTSFGTMKKFAETTCKLNFCEICVQSRKVRQQLLHCS